MVALVLDGLVGFPAGLSLTSLHLFPSSFHLSPRRVLVVGFPAGLSPASFHLSPTSFHLSPNSFICLPHLWSGFPFALVLDGLVGFPAGLSPTSFHLFPTSFHLSPSSFHLSPISFHLSPSSFHLSQVGFPAGLSPTSFHLSPTSFHLSPNSFHLSPRLGCLRSGSRLSCLPLPFICLLFFPALDCCVRLILFICLPVSAFVSQLRTAVAASALQSFVSQL